MSGRAWTAGPVRDAAAFFRMLPELLPSGSVLYLEDVCSSDGVTLARSHCIEPQMKLALGTLWPRPNSFHLPLTLAIASGLAQLAEHHPTPEIAIHIHAYLGQEVLLEWHDAFTHPLRLALTLPEARVRHLCEALQCKYELEEPNLNQRWEA